MTAFAALDTSAGHWAVNARQTFDAWFARLPSTAQPQVRERFRSEARATHLGGYAELYVYELLRGLGHEVVVDIGNDAKDARIPDFRIVGPQDRFFVEVTAMIGDERLPPRDLLHEHLLADLLNAAYHADFWLDYNVVVHGASTPPKRITREIVAWLGQLAASPMPIGLPEELREQTRTFRFSDWVVQVVAIPANQQHADSGRMILGHLQEYLEIDDASLLRKKLRAKAGHYGELGEPFIVAVLNASTFLDDHDVHSALMGDLVWTRGYSALNGVWTTKTRPINKRLSAVLVANPYSATHAARAEPTLWRNPWATCPAPRIGPWRVIDFSRNSAIDRYVTPAIYPVATLLGLSDDWP